MYNTSNTILFILLSQKFDIKYGFFILFLRQSSSCFFRNFLLYLIVDPNIGADSSIGPL